MVLLWPFNFTKKPNLISKFSYDIIRYVDKLVSAYFFGPRCMSKADDQHRYAHGNITAGLPGKTLLQSVQCGTCFRRGFLSLCCSNDRYLGLWLFTPVNTVDVNNRCQ